MPKTQGRKRKPTGNQDHFSLVFDLIRKNPDAVLQVFDDGVLERTFCDETTLNSNRFGVYVVQELILAMRRATDDSPEDLMQALMDAARDCPDPQRKQALQQEAQSLAAKSQGK